MDNLVLRPTPGPWRLALAVRNYFAATLRLSSEGFEIGEHKVAWTDVAAFQRGTRFIGVFYAPGCERAEAHR